MEIPQDIRQAVAARKAVAPVHPDKPDYYSWVFHPETGEVHISDDHKKARRHKSHHRELAEKADHHPARVHGYAYRIRGGWRITDWEHSKVDRFIMGQVVQALNREESNDASEVSEVGPSGPSSDVRD